MKMRLPEGGRLIDRSAPVKFRFDGKGATGFVGDTLASALIAKGQRVVGRSFKYHRPRGVVASGAEEPNALVNLGRGARHEPNQRATTTEIFPGLEAESQNRWPSLEADVGAVNGLFARFLPAGFYYKTFIHPRPLWKHLFEPVIRQSAGLGKAPAQPDEDRYEHFHAVVDVLVVGGGMAGLTAALAAGATGARVLLVEQTAHWGGRTPVDVAGGEAAVEAALAQLRAMPNVHLRTRTMGAGVYDHGFILAYERVSDHAPGGAAPRHRLWKIRARQVVTATGAIERPLSFPGNDVPGVMLASAVRDYAVNWAALPGRRVVVVTNNDDAYRTALTLAGLGVAVPAVIDARPQGGGTLMEQARAAGIRVETGAAIHKVHGRAEVDAVEIGPQSGGRASETLRCDCVAMSGGWSPVVHLWSHCGGKLLWSDAHAHFHPDPALPPTGRDGRGFVVAAGAANGAMHAAEVAESGAAQGRHAAEAAGFKAKTVDAPRLDAPQEAPLAPVWIMPEGAGVAAREKMWLDFQNDVKVSDVQLAAQEGFESVEHAKRYTTLGMATDQGKLSNINGLAILSKALNEEIPRVGTTTFRPPYTPISLASIAGEARGATFQPIRRTPMHAWHQVRGARWEPVGHWRRPYAYPRAGESLEQAVEREVRNARQALGLLDASTLGKILVKGPDAGRFLDMLYTNNMSKLKVGR
ncbi:MAG: FAD-dependent oxidoreductase, partial [Deinococcus-Thermus bacterium]|nr:FAD-dependent oxidoreductase [Deinococcota bacterium]